MYPTVPEITPGSVRRVLRVGSSSDAGCAVGALLGQPEVEDPGEPAAVRAMFSGLMSRWMIPFSWAAARPSAICAAISAASRDRQRRVREPGPERLAEDELGHGVSEAVLFPDVEERDDVGVRKGCDRAGFVLEAPDALGVGWRARPAGS